MTLFNMKFELKIEELILSDNLIEKINRNDLQLLRDLIVIDLSYNKISSIDENAFLNNPKLIILDETFDSSSSEKLSIIKEESNECEYKLDSNNVSINQEINQIVNQNEIKVESEMDRKSNHSLMLPASRSNWKHAHEVYL